jgi:hypothetical protein
MNVHKQATRVPARKDINKGGQQKQELYKKRKVNLERKNSKKLNTRMRL